LVWLLFIFPARVNKKCADEEKKTTRTYVPDIWAGALHGNLVADWMGHSLILEGCHDHRGLKNKRVLYVHSLT
jgi:hypothetical protein